MVGLPASLAGLNKAAVAAAKGGRHEEALQLYQKVFQEIQERHLSHPQLFITHSNKAASHLALGQYTAALQDAKQCLDLLTSTAATMGLFTPSRHPHWPKACLRLGQAFAGLGQHQQAAAAFEAGLAADPLNSALRYGLQQAQQGLAAELLSGKSLAHVKALPAPATPERITLTPHNAKGVRASADSVSSSCGRVQRRGHAVGWQGAGDAAAALLAAAETVQSAVEAAEAEGADAMALSSLKAVAGAAGSYAAGSHQLPKLLLTPAAAAADVGLRDVYEYLSTQCAIRAPKQYMYRTLPDTPRMSAWWAATTAAVQAVHKSGRMPRVLLLGAKAGVLAVAALRAGAAHVTCVEGSPYLAAACAQVLQDNGFPTSIYTVICTPSPSTLKIGTTPGTDVPNICNCLIADIIEDGVLSGGLIPAVAHALEELLVREQPVLVPQRLTVMAQAVGVRPSVVEVEGVWDSGSSDGGNGGGCGSSGKVRLDLTAMDPYRWTPSQTLPSPLDPTTFIPLSDPKPVWHLPLADVVADRSAVQHMDVQLTTQGAWCAVAFWADLDLFDNITYTTAGPWAGVKAVATNGSSSAQPSFAANTGSSGSYSATQPDEAGLAAQAPATAPATPLLLTYPTWEGTAQDVPASESFCGHTSTAAAAPVTPTSAPAKPAVSKAAVASAPLPVFHAPPSQQPAVCWLPGGLPVSEGDVYPLVASHNTVRCMFTIQEADYSFLFQQEPSFPHSHFAMNSDTQRLQAYATAMRKALDRAAATEQRQQQQQRNHATAAMAPVSATQHGDGAGLGGTGDSGLTVLDLGCGSGVLSLLAAAALSAPMLGHTSSTCEPAAAAAAARDTSAYAFEQLEARAGNCQQLSLPVTSQPLSGSTPPVAAPGAAVSTPPDAPRGSVVGVELTAPLAGVAQRAVAANGVAEAVSVIQADVGSCRRGQQVPIDGADVIVLDMFDSGLNGHGVLGLVEMAKATLAAEGAQIVPASASLYCMGVEVLTVNSWDGMQQQQEKVGQAAVQQEVAVNLQALEAYTWSDEPDTVLLHHIPHKPLTAPAKLADFDFCAPAGTPYPKDMDAQLEVVAEGKMHAVVVWFDLHLAEGVSITSAPMGYTTGARAASNINSQQQHHWGQSLHHLDAVPRIQSGDIIHLGALREGPKLSFGIVDASRPSSSAHSPCIPTTEAPNNLQQHSQDQDEQDSDAVPLQPAPRPPWLRPGAGIEDPAVWSVKKCQQLLGQMLVRAPGAKFPPIWKDLELMQVHAGSLGLCAATVGAVTQEVTMREALAVASQKQLTVSLFALPEAAGIQPPAVWR